MLCNLLLHDCSVLTPEMTVTEHQSIAINDGKIIEIGPADELKNKYTAEKTLSGRGKLAMPGLVDGHIHVCQQLLRGRTIDEWPMIWTRFLVPFESNLTPDDVYHSAQLACLEMIKSGTTSFIESGGVYMERAAEAALESGMRAAIACSTMDMGSFITGQMKDTVQGNLDKTERLYNAYHGTGDGRIHIWYAMRQVMTCSPELVRATAQAAREKGTGIHAHLCEHRDEVRFCLETYRQRPVEYLLENGMLGPNFLAAHSVALTEHDITLMKQCDVKVIHCPDDNLVNHGFSKTPRFLEEKMVVGLGSDGASSACLNLFDQMKFLRYGMTAYWGLPVFDPMVMPCDELLRMVTINGARAMQREHEIGTLEVGKQADIITLNISGPHLAPTSNLIKSLVTAAGPGDVTDSIINGKLVMENREVLTLDEEKIIAECTVRQKQIFARAGI